MLIFEIRGFSEPLSWSALFAEVPVPVPGPGNLDIQVRSLVTVLLMFLQDTASCLPE